MTNSIVEKVARAIQPYVVKGFSVDRIPEKAAQAVIEALDIIVLPKDAEPEIGDLILHRGYYGIFDSCGQIQTRSQDGVDCYNLRTDDYTIIQRQGKAVIQEVDDA